MLNSSGNAVILKWGVAILDDAIPYLGSVSLNKYNASWHYQYGILRKSIISRTSILIQVNQYQFSSLV